MNVASRPIYFPVRKSQLKPLTDVFVTTEDGRQAILAKNLAILPNSFLDGRLLLAHVGTPEATLYAVEEDDAFQTRVRGLLDWLNRNIEKPGTQKLVAGGLDMTNVSVLCYIRRVLRHWLYKQNKYKPGRTGEIRPAKELGSLDLLDTVLHDWETKRWSFIPCEGPLATPVTMDDPHQPLSVVKPPQTAQVTPLWTEPCPFVIAPSAPPFNIAWATTEGTELAQLVQDLTASYRSLRNQLCNVLTPDQLSQMMVPLHAFGDAAQDISLLAMSLMSHRIVSAPAMMPPGPTENAIAGPSSPEAVVPLADNVSLKRKRSPEVDRDFWEMKKPQIGSVEVSD